MAWLIVAIAEFPLLILALAAVAAQREKIVRLREAVEYWTNDYRRLEAGNERLLDKYFAAVHKDPIIIQPPDVTPIIRELGESIGTAIYGRAEQERKDLQEQSRATSMVEEKPGPGEWFPDVEFDTSMGPMPTPGGWVNGPANQNLPAPEGQTPTHAIVDGKLVRLDGQSAFQSGVGAPPPQGGIE